jgi:putative ABC transport system permease protein
MAKVWLHAWRSLNRGLRSGRLGILCAALVLAVAATGSVGLFTERVRLALDQQSGDTLGGDALLKSRSPLPDGLLESLASADVSHTLVTGFASVALAGERTSLVSVKAVGEGYPRRGVLQLSQEAFGAVHPAEGIPPRGEAWVDGRVLAELQLPLGGTFTLVQLSLRASALIAYEPDRSGGFTELAPRILIHGGDLAESGLITPGSRASYTLQLAGSTAAMARAQALSLPAGVRWVTPEEGRPEVKNTLNRAGQFLDIAGLAAALLAAAAVALTARQHGEALRDEIALLKTLGARQQFLFWSLTLHLLLLGLLAGVLGCGLAWGGQWLIGELLSGLLEVALPAPPLLPLAAAWGLSLGLLLGFAAPPVLSARRTPPLRVLARDLAAEPTRWVSVIATLAVVTLMLLWLDTPKLAATVLIGAGIAAGGLGLLAWLAVQALLPLKDRVGAAWKFGLGNIARRRGATVAQVVALGLGLLALLLITVVRQDLLTGWQRQLPPGTPNQFLINIQTEQVEPLRQFFVAREIPPPTFWPMTRGRLVALNGEPVNADSFEDPETQRWINREFNLSWTASFGDDNELLEGDWWDETAQGQPWLSVEDYAIERLHLKLGDTLTIDIAGTPLTLTVKNFRKVRWDRFQPNFFLVTPPGVLDAPGMAAGVQWLTSFHLPPGDKTLLRQLVTSFPNVTVFDLDATLAQVRGIIDRVVRAVEFVFGFALAAGLLVLLAAIEGTRALRARETALLRTLGASTATLRAGLLAEYAVLGALAGLIATSAAQMISATLATQVFELPFAFSPSLWVTGLLLGVGLVTGLGYLSMRGVLTTPPRAVLG